MSRTRLSPPRSRRALVAAFAGGALMLTAACGAGTKTAASQATSVGCAVTQPSTPTTVNILAYNSSAIDPFTNTLIASCQSPTLTFKHDPVDFGGQVQKTATTLAGAKGAFDLVEMYSLVIPKYNDKIVSLDDMFAKHKDTFKLGDLDPTMLKGMSYNGKLFGIPTQANITTFVYRKDIFDGLGLKPPKTFADLKDAAAKIQASGKVKYPVAMPLLASGDVSTRFMIGLFSQGTTYVDPTTKKPMFNSPQGKKALQAVRDLVPYMDPQVTTFDQPKVQQQMFNGTAAIGEMYSGRMLDLVQQKNSKFYDKFAFMEPPAIEAGGKPWATVSVDGWSIPQNTSVDKDLVFQVMAASVSEAAGKAAVPGAFPSRKGLATSATMPWFDAVTATLNDGAQTPPMEKWTADMQTATREFIAQGITGALSVDDALAKAQAAAEKVLAAAGG
ncbi:extracellular solute-binding protein [Lapillicoccus sp.]|uniref:ABC transporter substrate-binding protein n=1 Tax=Lapillicoccus sp. TaxID=1909287 RepID=UPI0027CCEEAD|nr:extracellular solute-binding protein [Actinomycetota bacterium]